MVMMARISDGAEILLRAPTDTAGSDKVTAIAWQAAGGAVAFGTQAGKAGLLTF